MGEKSRGIKDGSDELSKCKESTEEIPKTHTLGKRGKYEMRTKTSFINRI